VLGFFFAPRPNGSRVKYLSVPMEPERQAANCSTTSSRGLPMSLGTIVLIILVIALLGGFSGIGGGPFYGTGYYGGGGLGIVLVIVLILVLMGRF
jgi:hypothetical protein